MLANTHQPLSPAEMVVTLGGKRYFLATKENFERLKLIVSPQLTASRAWDETYDVDQPAPSKPFQIPIGTFHDGAGFSYANLPSTYEIAHQFDASTPGRPATWALHATGTAKTGLTAGNRGFLRSFGGYLYMCKDRYTQKYVESDTPTTTWTIAEEHDHGAGNYVPGRPDDWGGDFYVARRSGSTNQRFEVITAVATPPSTDTWTTGPVGILARGFFKWKELLGRFFDNSVAFCAVSPATTATDWSDDGGVGGTDYGLLGDAGVEITDALSWQQYVECAKPDGLYSVDENLYPRNELPDMVSIRDAKNGVAMWNFGGDLMIPHVTGLLRWKPARWRFNGMEQEGATEGDITPGWGRCLGGVSYGSQFFAIFKDEYSGGGSIVSFQQPRGGRGPLVPHMHYRVTTGWFEDITTHQSATGILYLCALYVNSADTSAQPYIWRLPGANMSPANDPRVPKGLTSDGYLKTSRYYQPSRAVSKVYRSVDFYGEFTGGNATNGFQIWASIDEGTAFQLLDAAGAAATVTTDGYTRLYFPTTSAAVGRYCQLELRAESSGTSFAINALRDIEIRGTYRPIRLKKIQATLILTDAGQFEDGGDQMVTGSSQYDNLVALAGPVASVTTYQSPFGETGFCSIDEVLVKDGPFTNEGDTRIVGVTIYEESYGA